jgi:short-subunit dehydrogenase
MGLGAGYLLVKGLSMAYAALLSLRPAKDLPSRYGQKTWVLITGASEGIGRLFAGELGRQGFNIVLLDSDLEKLKQAEESLLIECQRKIQTKLIVADLTKANQEDFADEIYAQIQDLDVSILINNAGLFLNKLYLEATTDEIRNLVIVNTLANALITRALLPRLAARTQRSAIINLSSMSGVLPMPRQQIYGATKSFMSFFSRGLASEYSNLDILSVQPGLTHAKETEEKHKDCPVAKPEEVVRASLKSLGYYDHTCGHWKHESESWLMKNLPEFLRTFYIKKIGPL